LQSAVQMHNKRWMFAARTSEQRMLLEKNAFVRGFLRLLSISTCRGFVYRLNVAHLDEYPTARRTSGRK